LNWKPAVSPVSMRTRMHASSSAITCARAGRLMPGYRVGVRFRVSLPSAVARPHDRACYRGMHVIS